MRTTEHCTLAPWRGHWDDVTQFPKVIGFEAILSVVRVAAALYFLLGFGAPIVFASKVVSIFVAAVVFDSGSFLTLKRILRPRRSTSQRAVTEAELVPKAVVASVAQGRVLYDYGKTDAKDVSVKAGDLVSIVQVHDDGWTEVLLANGERGLCPSTCVGAA